MPDGHVRMGVRNQLRAIDNGFAIVASFPELRDTPIVIGESDPEGCAACPVRTNPSNAYRNGTMYSSYTAEQLARTYELADRHKVNLLGAVTWAFEFEDQPYFAGFRDLATNGIDKPVLNVFRMLGRMSGDRVAVESSGALPLDAIRDTGCADAPDVSALASRGRRAFRVRARLELSRRRSGASAGRRRADRERVTAGTATLTHYRVDDDHSNAYAAWLRWDRRDRSASPSALDSRTDSWTRSPRLAELFWPEDSDDSLQPAASGGVARDARVVMILSRSRQETKYPSRDRARTRP